MAVEMADGRRRTRMVRPYPMHSLEDALAIARAVQERNAGLPFDRILLAKALGTTPTSSGFTMKLNSSVKYGLTQGGYNDARISLTPRGQAIVAPRDQAEQRRALLEAALQPEIFGQFYRALDGKRIPEDEYAQGMLQREFGVQPDLAAECLGIIKANGLFARILEEVGGSLYVNLRAAQDALAELPAAQRPTAAATAPTQAPAAASPTPGPAGGQLYIGRSSNPEAVQAVKQLLEDFGIPYLAAEDGGEASGVAVPPQTSAAMRQCCAGILVFARPGASGDASGLPATARMLLELGAASVLYGPRVVVLREAGLDLGGALSGLRSVEFQPDRPQESALALLRELHRAGIVRVVMSTDGPS